MGDQPTEYGWVILELMGRTRVAGLLTRDEIGLRLDMPETPGHPASTHWYGPSSWYGIHAVDEATARQCAAAWRPEPVRRWELPAAPEPRQAPDPWPPAWENVRVSPDADSRVDDLDDNDEDDDL